MIYIGTCVDVEKTLLTLGTDLRRSHTSNLTEIVVRYVIELIYEIIQLHVDVSKEKIYSSTFEGKRHAKKESKTKTNSLRRDDQMIKA